MPAKHLPLLSVFAGGCLSGAVAVALLANEAEPRTARAAPASIEQSVAPPRATHDAARDDVTAEAATARATSTQPPQRSAHDDGGDPSAQEATRSVADILLHLEAAYREQLAEVARSVSPPPLAKAPVEAAPEREPRAREQAPPAPALRTTSSKALPEVEAPPARVAELEAAPPAPPRALASETKPPSVAYAGDVQQNIYVGDVVQGDVYQLQQLAVLQYLQLLALSPQTRFMASAPPARGRAGLPQPGVQHTPARRRPAFPSSVTNPENPWGFVFPPPMLAK
jgi:hypothetical protein